MLTVGLVGVAYSEGTSVGTSCTLSWTAPPEAVDGYKVYVGATADSKTLRATVTTTSVSCATLNVTAGQQYAHVVAFNVVGSSAASDTLPFYVVTTVPSRPAGLFIR